MPRLKRKKKNKSIIWCNKCWRSLKLQGRWEIPLASSKAWCSQISTIFYFKCLKLNDGNVGCFYSSLIVHMPENVRAKKPIIKLFLKQRMKSLLWTTVCLGSDEQHLACLQPGLSLLNSHCSGLDHLWYLYVYYIDQQYPPPIHVHTHIHTVKSKERIEQFYIYCTINIINILKYLFSMLICIYYLGINTD